MSTFLWQLAAFIVSVAVLVFVGFSTAATRAETHRGRVEHLTDGTTITYQRLLEDGAEEHFVPGRYPAPWWWKWREPWRRLRGRHTFAGLFIFHRDGKVREVIFSLACQSTADAAFNEMAYELGITDRYETDAELSASYSSPGYTAYVWALKLNPRRK